RRSGGSGRAAQPGARPEIRRDAPGAAALPRRMAADHERSRAPPPPRLLRSRDRRAPPRLPDQGRALIFAFDFLYREGRGGADRRGLAAVRATGRGRSRRFRAAPCAPPRPQSARASEHEPRPAAPRRVTADSIPPTVWRQTGKAPALPDDAAMIPL